MAGEASMSQSEASLRQAIEDEPHHLTKRFKAAAHAWRNTGIFSNAELAKQVFLKFQPACHRVSDGFLRPGRGTFDQARWDIALRSLPYTSAFQEKSYVSVKKASPTSAAGKCRHRSPAI
jgi:hypothetical protein